jgi:hypothetical protein
MSTFSPLTLGYDWEVWALKPDMTPADGKKVDKITDRINKELRPLEAHREWVFIEMGPGIVREWQELVNRTDRYVKWVQEQCIAEEIVFYPCGTIFSQGGTAGLHVHVGTVSDAVAETQIRNALIRYLPALIALMASSPMQNWEHSKLKCYRAGGSDWGSGGIYPAIEPHVNSNNWGGDVCVRRSSKPTIEIRLADSCCSPRLLVEYALIIAGLTDWISNHIESEQVSYTHDEYEEYLVNRWLATRDGLQATLSWNGSQVSVVKIIEEIIEKASAGMRKLAASVEDLTIIPLMLEKRQTQADFQMMYLERHSDAMSCMRAYADVLKDLSAFDQYLEKAPVLPQREHRDIDQMLLEKLSHARTFESMAMGPVIPPVILEKRLRRLEAEGKVEVTVTPEDGIMCRRVKNPERVASG